MTTLIRRARRDDADELSRVALLSKQSNGYDDAFMAACEDELLVTPELIDAREYWVAADQTICGFVCLQADRDSGWGTVSAFFVHPDWQKRGVGRLLWRALEGSARAKGLEGLSLDADPAAEPFYVGLGFSTVGRVPSGSIPGRTLPHMQLRLLVP